MRDAFFDYGWEKRYLLKKHVLLLNTYALVHIDHFHPALFVLSI